eukprot:COSAG06_NODE_2181_length_7402_cov_8.928933_4_plen_43_part_00
MLTLSVPTLASWLPAAIDERLLPEFEQTFGLAPEGKTLSLPL